MQVHPLDLARRWLGQAAADLEAAEQNALARRYSLACFLSQQSVDVALKAALIWRRGDHPRTHTITFLLDELREADVDTAERLAHLSSLDVYY